MGKDEALKLALEALKIWEQMYPKSSASAYRAPAITAIKEALAQLEQEPFGYFKAEPFGWTDCAETDDDAKALYEAPPQRPWVGLTEVDILAASRHWRHAEDFMAGVYWAAGTLKEFNT